MVTLKNNFCTSQSAGRPVVPILLPTTVLALFADSVEGSSDLNTNVFAVRN